MDKREQLEHAYSNRSIQEQKFLFIINPSTRICTPSHITFTLSMYIRTSTHSYLGFL